MHKTRDKCLRFAIYLLFLITLYLSEYNVIWRAMRFKWNFKRRNGYSSILFDINIKICIINVLFLFSEIFEWLLFLLIYLYMGEGRGIEEFSRRSKHFFFINVATFNIILCIILIFYIMAKLVKFCLKIRQHNSNRISIFIIIWVLIY